jgi:rRNA maturation protein Nop10
VSAPSGLLICVCGSCRFYAVPDGANSYLLECTSCGRRSEISAPPGVTLELTELPKDAPNTVHGGER